MIDTGAVPELPEVESARTTIERAALHRPIADVDDHDTWECRPHAPGEIRAALVGRALTAACRQGKSLWCETSGSGPVLGLHLGMSGRILVTDGAGALAEGGDRIEGSGGAGEQADRRPDWVRFAITFDDGGTLRLFDKRRLGRVRLDPGLADLGPDAERIGVTAFRERVDRGTAPVKARLLDQSVLAGVGNLLADETLWQARLDPRPARRHPRGRRADEAAPRPAEGHAGGHPPRRRAHRRRHPAPASRRPLSALRRRPGTGDGGRPDDLVLPARAAVIHRAARTETQHSACRDAQLAA
jgi:formamidopyrimidine-DNA glycosylase